MNPSSATSRHKRPTTSSPAKLDVDPSDICLTACHVWDTIGAGAAGWQTALILREGNAPLDVGPRPIMWEMISTPSPISSSSESQRDDLLALCAPSKRGEKAMNPW